MTSQLNMGKEDAAMICGIWTLEADIAELLVREVMMCAWEIGFHVLFSFENHLRLKKIGFHTVEKKYFASNLDKYDVKGIELSWNGFEIINKDLVLPKAFFPSINQLNHYSNN